MVLSHHHTSAHRHDLTFESLCHFSKSKCQACLAGLHHITSKDNNQQRVMSVNEIHVVSCRTLPRPKRAINLQPMSDVKCLGNKQMVEEQEEYYTEDVLAVEWQALQATEVESVEKLAEKTEEQQ